MISPSHTVNLDSEIAEFRELAKKWNSSLLLIDSVSVDALSDFGGAEGADFARNILGSLLERGRASLPGMAKEHLDRLFNRLFQPLIPGFELPIHDFTTPLGYAKAVIADLPQLQVKSVVEAADRLFRSFHPEGRGMFESKRTAKGYLFTFPAYFDGLLNRLSYGTAEFNMERAKALWIVHEQLCPLAPFDLSELESAFRTQHRPVFTRQTVRVSTFATVTLFKSAIKFELSLEALEALQLIWDQHNCRERLAA